jgi:hypothetical protein
MELKEKKFRQYRSNQGRSPEKMEANYKVFGYGMLIMVLTILGLLISKLF